MNYALYGFGVVVVWVALVAFYARTTPQFLREGEDAPVVAVSGILSFGWPATVPVGLIGFVLWAAFRLTMRLADLAALRHARKGGR